MKVVLLAVIVMQSSFVFGQTTDSTQNGVEVVKVNSSPTYPGGNEAKAKFLAENAFALDSAETCKIEAIKLGRLTTKFKLDVLASGEIVNVSINESSGLACFDQEMLRLINLMPIWNPAIHEGEAVAIKNAVMPLTMFYK